MHNSILLKLKKHAGVVLDKLPNYITAFNLLIIVVGITVIYLLYKWWLTTREGFEDNIRSLTDLLDKQKVNIYGLTPLWDNILYSSQPQKREKPISFWLPSKESGEQFKEIGHCVTDNPEYNSPEKTTMLVKGDTKPPIDSKLIFSFPDNVITASMYDAKGNQIPSVYTKIRTPADITERIEKLKKHLEDIQADYDLIKEEVEKKLGAVEDKSFTQYVEVCKKNNYFLNPIHVYEIKPGQTVNIAPGEYSTLRFPLGSSVSLKSSTGRVIEFEVPYDTVLNETLDGIAHNGLGPSYGEVLNSIKGDSFSKDDFNAAGKYGFSAHDEILTSNDRQYSTEETNYSQTETQAYMPYSKDFEYGMGKITVPVRFSYNYAIGTANNHNLYGRDQLYTYYTRKMATQYKTDNYDNEILVRTGGNMLNFSKSNIYLVKDRDSSYNLTPGSGSLYNSMLDVRTDRVPTNFGAANTLFNKIKNMKREHADWYITEESMVDNPEINDIIGRKTTEDIKNYSMDMAFMLTTYINKLRMEEVLGVSYAADVNGSSCCEISSSDITEESLSRSQKFQGYLTGGTVTLNIKPEQLVVYNKIKARFEKLLSAINLTVSNVANMVNQLENLQRDISENKLAQFPLKIYRPVPPPEYIDLGDLLYTNADVNYHRRRPILDTIACVPAQCARDVREWLPVDKIYEYSQGDVYLAIYRNPYLQTFRASTIPGVLPPGKVVKVVACVEKCKLLDDIIEADKCAKTFYSANKSITEGNNLDRDKPIMERESALYKNEISAREDRLNTMRELARRLQIQDAKADIINKEYNRQQLQSLVDTQRVNMNKLVDNLDAGRSRVDINIKFDYDKFAGLITLLKPKLPESVYKKITMAVSNSAKQKLDAIPDETVNDILGYCPSPETQGLVVKALVESGCYNCSNLA